MMWIHFGLVFFFLEGPRPAGRGGKERELEKTASRLKAQNRRRNQTEQRATVTKAITLLSSMCELVGPQPRGS